MTERTSDRNWDTHPEIGAKQSLSAAGNLSPVHGVQTVRPEREPNESEQCKHAVENRRE